MVQTLKWDGSHRSKEIQQVLHLAIKPLAIQVGFHLAIRESSSGLSQAKFVTVIYCPTKRARDPPQGQQAGGCPPQFLTHLQSTVQMQEVVLSPMFLTLPVIRRQYPSILPNYFPLSPKPEVPRLCFTL